jgi:DNA-binding transcriptional ArsR family regulator
MDTTVIDLAKRRAALCKSVGNSRRLIILWLLAKEEFSVNEIAERVGSSLQNISQHLSLLNKAGIVTTRRSGQTIYYQIADYEWLQKCPALLGMPEKLD